jgi:L-ascorbate metabolism protein UlaG (beta-lactamase superfamily)
MNRFHGSRYLTAAVVITGLAACGQAEQVAEAPAAPAPPPPPVVEAAPAPNMGANVIATSMGDLIIHPIHHASMILEWNGMNILIDPAPPVTGVADGVDITAEYTALAAPDLTLVTDIHGDHLSADILSAVSGAAPIVAPQAVADELPDALQVMTQVVANGESVTVQGIQIEAVPMYNLTEDRLMYHDSGRGNGYVLTLGDTRVYIAGDTEDIPEMRALTDIDVAFIPMNLPYTMTPEQAADAVVEFQPTVVFPYHYGMSDLNVFTTNVGDASEVRLLEWY